MIGALRRHLRRQQFNPDLSGAFVTPPQYGADGAGSVNDGISYALVLTGEDVFSGMYGLEVGDVLDDGIGGDDDGIGQGEAIVLNQDPITGLITGSGADSRCM